MKLYYVTLNSSEEARQIGRSLLEKKLALCVNWFPITCAYSWKGEIVEEPEVVLIVKTLAGYQADIEQEIRQHITYTNFIAELSPTSVNQGFLDWLNAEIPQRVG
ncbi:divalent-cation tolerance protein CutA [Aetokthonos hydrillicola Thurmond2011]|jgi:periplasmic divalent cation tolerance protein|uniref:Divalent-cation tolerance protein CutA n=1 Tax=Aetokthonos hydrillicola Thurmond2011 TaxID=2712845 RepID=A0AAP5IED3_9CYAN|nr:divalent-cation tolerance protein CutA [Aetokthonos hydrillicola]MBO3457253.1 divalent-cation tolerance protein CutA [Aetokthonos hydrillicola CCALA 1050]MBW4586594.1 divalent-cation tolerance protein CutA [Aetokthonos hydrillicola CCALA 1050]MDR9900131.1 divalent-cation tolerance protein CutA [Aetokthonos hydrillicola Thurmond2011]